MCDDLKSPNLARVGDDHPMAALITEAYALFSRPAPQGLEVCTSCCLCPTTERAMLASTSRDLTRAQIWEWYNAALHHVGHVSKPVWCFLLPRILEILAANDDAHNGLGPAGTFTRFPMADRQHWNAAEWDLLDRYRWALLDLSMTPGALSCDSVLGYIEGFVAGGYELGPMVAWLAAQPPAALVDRLYGDLRLDPQCYDRYGVAEQTRAALSRDAVLDPLLAFALSVPDPQTAQRAQEICDLLLTYRAGV